GNYRTTADLSGLADGNLTVEASVTDAAGNPARATDDTSVLDTSAPEARITLDADITPDDVINAAEAGQQIPVTGRVGGDVKVGDTVTLTVNGKAFTGQVLADKRFSINVPGSDLAADGDKVIDAKVTTTDAAGNSTTATDTEGYRVDTQGPSVVVDIVDTALNVADKVSSVTFTFSEVPVGFTAADLTVSGGTISSLVQSASDPTVWTATFTATDGFTGTASVAVKDGSYTDAAGNPGSAGSDTVAVDTQAPTASITLDGSITADDVINAAESKQNIAVTGTVGGDVKVGDTVTLTVNGKAFTGQVLADKRFSINVPGSDLAADGDKVIDAKVTTTDAAGNSTTATDTEGYRVDTQGPSVVVDIVATELKVDDTSAVTFTFSEPVQAFGLDDLAVVGGSVSNLTSSADGKSWTATFTPTPGFEGTASVTVKDNSYTDVAGNQGTGGSDSAAADTQATAAPTVVITEDTNDDGTIDRTEVSGPVNVEVTLPAEAKVGDTLKVSGQTDRQLSEADILAGKVGYEFDRPADGATLAVTATLVDAAGNVSLPGSDSATMYHDAPPVTIGGHGIGLEDIPLVLAWDQFGASDDQADGELSVVIGSLPQNGTLQYLNAAGQWVAVKVGDSITSGEIKAGQLRLVPGSHESSTDNSNGQGNDSGNLKGDYASFEFKVSDGTQLSNSGTLVIDIEAVADKPVVEVTLSSNGTPLYQGFPSFGISTDSFQSGNIDYVALGVGDPKRDASSGNDQLNGSNTKNDYLLSSKGGGDMLYGKGGDDLLVGGNADQGDSLYGGTGNDILVAGLGNDGLYGGTGDDIAVLRGNRADYVVKKGSGHSVHDAWFDFSVNEGGTGVTKALHDIEHVQFDDGIYAINQATGELTMVQPTQVDYPVDIKVSLTDRDGSEVLDSLLLSGLPAGSKLYQGSDLLGTVGANGTLSLPASSGLWSGNALDVSLSGLTLRVPGAQAGQVDLKVEATTRELHTDQTNTASDDDSIRLSYFQGTEGEQGDQTHHYGSEHNLVVGDLDGSVVLSGQNYNIAFIVDSSGSIGDEAMVTIRTQLEQVFTSLKASAGTDNAGTVNLLLVDFDTTTRGSVSVNLADSGALKTLLDALKGMSADGGTNYEAAFSKAANWFAGSTATSNVDAKNLAYFITDGKPTFYDLGTTTRLSDVKVIDWAYSSDEYLNSTSLNLGNYVLGNTVTYRGVEVVNSKGEVIKWSEGWGGWFTTTVGVIVKGSNGQNQIQLLGGDGRNSTDDVRTDALLGYQLLTSKGVLVEAIGLGANISEADLKSYDSDGITHTNVDASDLASTILGATSSNLPGSDRFDGGAGDDILFGDAMHFNGIAGEGYAAIKAYVADKLNQNAVLDAEVHRYIQQHASEFDQSSGNDKADVLMGGEGSDILYGQGGNDILDGGSGDDILFGGVGNDTLYGGLGDDSLHGGSGTDTLYGGEGNDILNGGTGDDWLIGGLGNDILTGADGSDIFVWSKGDIEEGKLTVDTITDFNPSRDDASQRDKLDLRDLLDQDDTQHPDDLKSLLSVFQDDEGVHLQVKTSASSEVAQEIVLVNHSFDTLTGNSGATSSQVIDFMLNNHMLEIDK
ncbi:Ig-like domain-containing protein, partial [Aeromonas bivalvium]|uniref:Ig-like domain-containing protein n=1 Tax=Aeromonas bivalvium TaxID=440079 RepID=UPI0038CFD737